MNEYAGNLNLNLSGQISYKDYRNTLLELSFKSTKAWISILVLSAIAMLVLREPFSPFTWLILFGILCFMTFFSVIYSAKSIYRENKSFHEKFTYHLDNEKITITSETANATQKWSRFFEIKETQTSFVLYHDSIVANYLDKKMFSAEEIVEFRKFLNSLDVKKKLKKG